MSNELRADDQHEQEPRGDDRDAEQRASPAFDLVHIPEGSTVNRDELRTFLAPLPDEAVHALTLYGEARGEPIEGLIGVSCAIRNRVRDGKQRWGGDYRAVCLQKAQFSCWSPKGGEANHKTVLDAALLLLDKRPVPPLLEQCAWVALGVSKGALLDTVKGANHYHTVSMKPRPQWAQSYVPITQKASHLFYKL